MCELNEIVVNRQKRNNGMHEKMVLTFEKNKFLLRGEDLHFEVDQSQWEMFAGGYSTRKLKEAARFRVHEDATAKRIFDKFALKDIELPTGGFKSLDKRLMPFQRNRGIPFILGRNRTYLAHDPGLGKTAQAISAVSMKPGRTLIVAPSFLKTNWAREITDWFIKDFPQIAVVPESANQAGMNWNADFIIVSDSMILRSWVRQGISKTYFRFVFVDEGHRFKNPAALRSVILLGGKRKVKKSNGQDGVLKSPGFIYNSEHVSFLSGTPLLSRPMDLWTILYSMAPEVIDFMTYQEFGFKYCGPWQDEWGHYHFTGASHEEELSRRIYSSGFMQRITKKEVLKELPDKIREIVFIDRDSRTSQLIKADFDLQKTIETDFERPASLGKYATIRHETGRSKVEFVARFVNEHLTENVDEQIILYGYHRDVVDNLAFRLKKFAPMIINGGVPNEKRLEFEDLFQSRRRRLIIGNIRAMNLGLTLTAATRVIFAEYSETPSENEQAEDRAHRIGQHDSVYCQYLVLPNSLDEIYLNMILRKQKTIKKVIG